MILHTTRLLLLCGALTGCASAPPTSTPTTTSTRAAPAAVDRFAGLPPLVCPEGASPRTWDRALVRWCVTADGVTHGPVEAYNNNKQTLYIFAFERGAPHGVWTGYWLNGKARWRATYERGVLQGDVDQWYMEGQQRTKLGYKDGQPHGWRVGWYKDGKRAVGHNLANGMDAVQRPRGAPVLDGAVLRKGLDAQNDNINMLLALALVIDGPSAAGPYKVLSIIAPDGMLSSCVTLEPGRSALLNAALCRELEFATFPAAPQEGKITFDKTFLLETK